MMSKHYDNPKVKTCTIGNGYSRNHGYMYFDSLQVVARLLNRIIGERYIVINYLIH